MQRRSPTRSPLLAGALTAGAVLGSIALAGCGSSEPGAEPATTTTAAPTTTEAPTTTTTAPTSTTGGGSSTSTTVAVAGMPDVEVTALGKGGTEVYVIGDSVLLGAKEEVPAELEGWDVTMDAEGSRRLTQAIPDIEENGADARVVVINLGNNYIPNEASPGGATTFAEQIDETMEALPDVDRVVWVTVAEVSDSRRAINEAIRDAADEYDNAVVLDWAAVVEANPGNEEIAGDALHLGAAGQQAIAELISMGVGPAPS
jgi:hypothetical protein